MPVAWWILNYKKYDPEYKPEEWEAIFRDNVLNVADNEVDRFVAAIESDKLSSNLEWLGENISLQYRKVYIFLFISMKKNMSVTFLTLK